MTKFIGAVVWLGSLLTIVLSAVSLWTEEALGYAVALMIALLILGIGRRIFNIPSSVVEDKGLIPAILSRINCMRFYCSLIWYPSLVATVLCAAYVFEMDFADGWLYFGISAIVMLISRFLLRRTCPRCGYRCVWDGDADDGIQETTIDEHGWTTKQGMTEYYHCPRCGRKVSIHKKRTVAEGRVR